MKPRTLSRTIFKAIKTFPAIVVTGPRQSGKTTLFKLLFSKTHTFVSLEDPDVRMRAKEDPLAFLAQYKPPVIIDEIQYAPELLSYIKTKIDSHRKPGQWLFTGSQNFTLMQGVSQSLAGRAAVLTLLPFSFSERIGIGAQSLDVEGFLRGLTINRQCANKVSIAEVILKGCYPEPASKKAVDRQLWCGSYIATYLERDVRNLAHVGDLSQFERFLRLCALRTGQILNLSDLARDIGISVPTARRWLSILEASSQIFLVHPYYGNIGKRLIKSPKIYFNDTALASYLMGIHDRDLLLNSPNFGHIFETLVVTDVLKRFLHNGMMPAIYFLRTRDGLEVDLVVEWGQKLHLFELKAMMTILPRHAAPLLRAAASMKNPVGHTALVSLTAENFSVGKGVYNYSWKNFLGV